MAATACVTCHDGSVANAKAKHAGHLPTSDLCADCHTTTAFTPARFDHNDPNVAGRACATCHDGTTARGQSASHIATGTQACNDCHTTASWATSGKPDHSGFANNCFTCHTGAPNATGKPQTHFATSNNCDVCHTTTAFKPAAFEHAEATSTANCFACHDGAPAHAPALGKSSFPAHPATSNQCQTCHTGFSSWAGASFKHDDPVVAAAACFSCHDGQHAPAEGKLPTHFKTGNDCASCHVTLNWTTVAFDHTQAQGTCVSCHDNAHPPAKGKGQNHLQTSNVCEDCHTTAAWSAVTFDHTAVAGTACFTCHNGTRARGKGQAHFATTNTCDDCHTTTGWSPASFDHGSATSVTNCINCHDGDPKHAPALGKSSFPGHVASSNDCQACHNSFASWATANFSHDDPVVSAAACFSCHDGQHSPAAGKSQTHFKSSNDCAACHTTTNWTTATFDHSQALGTCVSCHDGRHTPARGKGNGHVGSTDSCDSCHVTTNWTTVAFDHSQATGSCVNCHDGAHPPAVGKGTRHFVTAQPCEICHTSTAWTPVLPYTHMSAAYENHGNNVSTCTDCHKQNNEKIAFARPDLAPDCAACHVSDYKQDPHKKYTSPTTKFYTVDELRDCTGACHIYSDQTMATIKTRRTGPEHRATGGF